MRCSIFETKEETSVIDIYKRFATAGMIAAALAAAASAQTTGDSVPRVPANLEVPSGNTVFLAGRAIGTQNYVCLPAPSGVAWTFFNPQATVFFDAKLFGIAIDHQIITHFLSPNPAEKDTARVTWQSSEDSSAVWGKAAQSSTDPGYVAARAIPWVLLQAVGTKAGPTGGDTLAQTTYVQRLNTAGGVAPQTGCADATNIGATALVPYTADYFFYKAAK